MKKFFEMLKTNCFLATIAVSPGIRLQEFFLNGNSLNDARENYSAILDHKDDKNTKYSCFQGDGGHSQFFLDEREKIHFVFYDDAKNLTFNIKDIGQSHQRERDVETFSQEHDEIIMTIKEKSSLFDREKLTRHKTRTKILLLSLSFTHSLFYIYFCFPS
jgi:hypothetical protein